MGRGGHPETRRPTTRGNRTVLPNGSPREELLQRQARDDADLVLARPILPATREHLAPAAKPRDVDTRAQARPVEPLAERKAPAPHTPEWKEVPRLQGTRRPGPLTTCACACATYGLIARERPSRERQRRGKASELKRPLSPGTVQGVCMCCR